MLAFGSPEGLRNTVTLGVVSSVARQTDPDSPMVYIQTDAPINPGNSGGPLVNVDGAVVGVNTFILSQSGGNEGLGFAIPSSVVSVAYQQLRKFGHIHRAQIGIGIQSITPILAAAMNLPHSYGVIVSDVLPDTPAMAAGLRVGDVLLTVDGRMADSVPYVSFRFMSVMPAKKFTWKFCAARSTLTFDVPVMEHSDSMDQISSLADPEKNLVRPLGILGIEIDTKIASMAPDLRDPFGIIVAAKSNEASADIPLASRRRHPHSERPAHDHPRSPRANSESAQARRAGRLANPARRPSPLHRLHARATAMKHIVDQLSFRACLPQAGAARNLLSEAESQLNPTTPV